MQGLLCDMVSGEEKFLQKTLVAQYETIANNQQPRHFVLKKGLCYVFMDNRCFTGPPLKLTNDQFMSLRIFANEKINFEDEEISLMNRSCKKTDQEIL